MHTNTRDAVWSDHIHIAAIGWDDGSTLIQLMLCGQLTFTLQPLEGMTDLQQYTLYNVFSSHTHHCNWSG